MIIDVINIGFNSIESIWVCKELTVSLKLIILFNPPAKNINNNKNA